MAGTYVATLTLFSISGSIVENWTSVYDTKVKEGIRLTPVDAQSGTVVYHFFSTCYSLDGNPAIDFHGLPAGFKFDSVNFNCNETAPFTTAIGFMGRGSSSDSISALVTWGTHSQNNICSVNSPTFPNINAPNVLVPKPLDFLSSLQIAMSDAANVGFADVLSYKNLKASGAYEIISVTTTPTTAAVGTPIKITAPSGLDTVADLKVLDSSGVVATPIIDSISPTEIDFHWPSTAAGPFTLIADNNDGTSYIVSPMVIILSDPSGLYSLVPGKTNDTLYLDHSTTTHDVAIPNPFIKTGFIDD